MPTAAREREVTRHLAAGTVAVYTGKPPRESDGLTLAWDAVTGKRCKKRLLGTMQRMGKKESVATLLGATKSEPRVPNRQRSQPR